MLSSYYLSYDTSESNQSSYLFYNVSLTEKNTWLEIPEPDVPISDKSSSSLVKILKEQNASNDKIQEDESLSKRITFTKSKIKHFNLKPQVKSSSLMSSPEINNQIQRNKIPFIEFQSYDIQQIKLRKEITNEEIEANEKLVKEYELNKIKKEEKERNEKEASKRKCIQQFNKAKKKEFDSSKFTFDSYGKVIQMKPINYETLFENNTEFIQSKPNVKHPPNVTCDNTNVIKENETPKEEKVIKNVEFFSIENNDYEYLPKKSILKKSKFKIPPGGNNFDIINPEVGVRIIDENNRKKEGSKNFNLKYNKTSIYDYSHLVNESIQYNDNMVKRGFISEQQVISENINNIHLNMNINTNTTDTQSQPYYGYKDNIISSNNPLVQNATKQIPLPHITTVNHEINSISPSYISTQSNPLINYTSLTHNDISNNNNNGNINIITTHMISSRNKIYRGNSNENQLHIKNMTSFKEFQRSIEIYQNDSSINIKQYHNYRDIHNKKRSHILYKRNASDFGEMFKHTFKTINVFQKDNKYNDVDGFNSKLIQNETRQNINNVPLRNVQLFKRLPKGNKIKELGLNIVNVKMPRERKFNLNQYNDITQQKYAMIHKRKTSMGL